MHAFKDKDGTTWELVISVSAIKRVKGLRGVNLSDLKGATEGETPLLTRLETDIELLADCVYAICKPQADSKGLDDLGFAELLSGEALADAIKAFWQELADFFQSIDRADQVAAVAKRDEVHKQVVTESAERITAISMEEVRAKMAS